MKILVTQPLLPPLEEYTSYLSKIWQNRWLTNAGPLVQELESKLADYLGVKYVFFVSNGTVALQIAIKALGLTKEIITTPFSFAATTNAILWEKCQPVFVDIDPSNYSIDPEKIESAITTNTEAIMPVHVYGYPSNVERIEEIAHKHHLKVIYDAAHAFGTKVNGQSVLTYGDIGTLSFHATKLFYTGEGGAIVTNQADLANKIAQYRDFGYNEQNDLIVAGINAKNSELHAAMGLCNLPKVNEYILKRQQIVKQYDQLLQSTHLFRPKNLPGTVYNYAYYPILFDSEFRLLRAIEALERSDIFPRRYFYPSLNQLPYLPKFSCPISEDISRRVLCLPLFQDLTPTNVEKIAALVMNTISQKPTLSVGIPALNEEFSIQGILQDLASQDQNSYQLENIFVMGDGSTDNTRQMTQDIAIKLPQIKYLDTGKRITKTAKLNYLYQHNQSDLFLALDADVHLGSPHELDYLVDIMYKDSKACVVGGNLVPVRPKGFIPMIIYVLHELWNEIRKQLSDSDHIANLYGAATLLKRDFSKTIIYPENITADEEYLYLKAKEKNGFYFAPKTEVNYHTAKSLKELRLQHARTAKERYSLKLYFKEDMDVVHHIPVKNKLIGIFNTFIRFPLYTLLALTCNLFLNIFPFSDELNPKGTWRQLKSTKIN